jgi:heterodisulfide reductase subunit A-like polyferredoxin
VNHLQRDSLTQLTVGAIIYAEAPERFNEKLFDNLQSIYQATPDSALEGSSAAARAMFDLFTERHPAPVDREPFHTDSPVRMGVFICQCGEEIARVVDTPALRQRADTWPDVSFAGELRFACSMEGAELINNAVRDHSLNRIVLAACSCCPLDQICFSCTYQRVRCKQNLGVFGNGFLPSRAFEFVNIREQCAWTLADDSKAATAKATALVAAAVAKARLPLEKIQAFEREKSTKPTVVVIGAGKAASACMNGLSRQGISALHVAETPSRIRHYRGYYAVSANGKTLKGSGVVLVPQDVAQLDQFKWALGFDDPPLSGIEKDTEFDVRQPGIISCSPGVDATASGFAAAARVAGWLGRLSRRREYDIATIDAGRCRACHTCFKTCEIGAPVLVDENAQRFAWIDPEICTGCGSCVSRCPSDAIRIGCSTDTQLAAMIDAVLE